MSWFKPSQAVQRIAARSERPSSRPGPDVIALSSGDPDFATPDYIRRALIDAVESGYTHYVDSTGDPELRAALAAQASTVAATGAAGASAAYEPGNVLVTHGGSGAISAAMLGTLDPGDRVLIPEPNYSAYADAIRLAGAEPVYVRQTADFHLDFEALTTAASGAKMVILCHPCNPTGVVYRRDELERLREFILEHDLLLLVDEAYDHIVFDGVEFVSTLAIEGWRERLIYCQTFSKTYAMTGWRLGYLIADAPVIAAAARVHRTLVGPLNAAVQRAGLAAITTPSDAPELMRREYQARRELVMELLDGAPGLRLTPPEGAFYNFIRYEAEIPSSEVAKRALEAGVAIRSGTEYGPSGQQHIRITFATDRKRLTEGVLRLRSLLGSL